MLTADPHAPAHTDQERVIAAPPERLFALMADVDAWPTWQPDVSRAVADGPVADGTTFRWTAGGARITSTIACFEPDRAIGWRGRTIGLRAVHTWTFESVADGATRVRTEESMEGWLARIAPGMVRRMLDRGVAGGLDALERAAAAA